MPPQGRRKAGPAAVTSTPAHLREHLAEHPPANHERRSPDDGVDQPSASGRDEVRRHPGGEHRQNGGEAVRAPRSRTPGRVEGGRWLGGGHSAPPLERRALASPQQGIRQGHHEVRAATPSLGVEDIHLVDVALRQAPDSRSCSTTGWNSSPEPCRSRRRGSRSPPRDCGHRRDRQQESRSQTPDAPLSALNLRLSLPRYWNQ